LAELMASADAAAARATSQKVHDPLVESRIAGIDEGVKRGRSPFTERRKLQDSKLDLPLFPTTTIGSFPQTSKVRQARAAHAKGELSHADYEAFLKQETEATIRWQEEIGL